MLLSLYNNLNTYITQGISAISSYLSWKEPLAYAITDLYDQSAAENIAMSSTMVVISGTKQNILAVASYGDQTHPDPAARKPLDFIKQMAGTENIINMSSEHSVIERQKIKPFLTEERSLTNVYAYTQELFQQLMTEEDTTNSFNSSISYACTNIIARCVLGIPELSKEQTAVIHKANKILREDKPGDEAFIEGQEEITKLNDELLTAHKNIFLNGNNYIHAKAGFREEDSDADKLDKILATRGVSNLLVESNLSTLILTAIVYLNQSESIRQRLLEEINSTSEMTLETMQKLPYLDCIYKEALRFASPTPFIIRETSKETNLTITDENNKQKLYSVPCSSLLFAPIRRIHHDPRYWKNPEQFNPERFENPEAAKHLIPFSIGSRSCPAASHFNPIVFKAALLASVHYQLQFDKPIEQIPADSLTSRWKNDLYVTEIHRNPANGKPEQSRLG